MSSKDYLQGMPSEIANQFDTRVVQDVPSSNVATQTSAITHVYADGTNGSDLNNGLTALTPKKTVQAAVDLLPYRLRHNTYVHLKGTFVDQGYIYFRNIVDTSYFVIDGGSELYQIDGPWTADISSSSTIGLSTLTLTPDQYAGYWIEFLSGPVIGQHVIIQSHTDTTFTLMRYLNPGNAQFRIVRPLTEIYSNSVVGGLYLQLSGSGQCKVQRLYLNGAKQYTCFGGARCSVAKVICDSNYSAAMFSNNMLYSPSFTTYWTNPDTGANVSYDYAGLSDRNHSFEMFGHTRLWNLVTSYLKGLRLTGGIIGSYLLYSGTRINGQLLVNGVTESGDYLISSQGSYTPVQIDGGILMKNSQGTIAGTAIVKNTSGHAFDVDNSRLTIKSNLSGTGSTGAGMYAHGGASVTFTTGNKPTVTGTVGDVSLDGTTQKSTWDDINGGTPIDGSTVGNSEFVLVKKS